MLDTLKRHAATASRVGLSISTMPWLSLQAPIEQILGEVDGVVRERQLDEWRARKNSEFEMVSFAGTLVASAVTGSIQWSSVSTAHWTIAAAWYSTLLLSLIAVVMAFHLSVLLSNFAIHPQGNAILLGVLRHRQRPRQGRWRSLFALQVPIMLLSYAITLYVVGLTLMVLWPLWSEPWGRNCYIAVTYGVFLVFALFELTWAAQFVYVQCDEVLQF